MTKTAELIITRIYNAPRELLFACMTEPAPRNSPALKKPWASRWAIRENR